MSYSIEYNRQFIRTEKGYIPLVLMGDNNVYDGSGARARRSRSWCVLSNSLFIVSKEELLDFMKSIENPYNQHWKRGGKWISNSGLFTWVRSGCASACSLDALRIFNPCLYITASLILYDKEFHRKEELKENLKSSEDLENWSEKAKAFIEGIDKSGSWSWYYHIDLSSEEIVHPPVGEGLFALRMSPNLYYIKPGKYSDNKGASLLMSADDWRKHFDKDNELYHYGKNVPCFIPVRDQKAFRGGTGYILHVANDGGNYAGLYIKAPVKRKCKLSQMKGEARRYASLNSAKATRDNLESRYSVFAGRLNIEKV